MKSLRCRLASTVLLVGALAFNSTSADFAGSEAPDFVLKSVSGKNLRLSEFRGRVVLLSFGASWCGECRSQLEGLEALRDRYEGAGFELISISLDRNMHDATHSAEAAKVGFPVLHDAGGAVGEQYDVSSVPYIVLIDRDGVVREEFEGYRRGEEQEYLERVRALLNE